MMIIKMTTQHPFQEYSLPTTCCPCPGFRHHNVSVSESLDADPYWPQQGSRRKGNCPFDQKCQTSNSSIASPQIILREMLLFSFSRNVKQLGQTLRMSWEVKLGLESRSDSLRNPHYFCYIVLIPIFHVSGIIKCKTRSKENLSTYTFKHFGDNTVCWKSCQVQKIKTQDTSSDLKYRWVTN